MPHQQQQNPTIPPAPRAPIFHRSAAPPPPYGFGYGQGDGYSMGGPAAPSSLAPVAMQSYAGATGSQRVQAQMPTVVIRGQNTMKWGALIVAVGAMIGGTLGVTMRNERIRAAAEHASAAQEMAPPPMPVPVPAATQASLAGPTLIPTQPPSTPPQAFANNTIVVPQAPVIIPPPPAKTAAVTKHPAPPPPVHHAAPPPAPPRGMVATKVTPPPAPPAVKDPPPKLPPKTKDNADAIVSGNGSGMPSGASGGCAVFSTTT